MQGKDGSQKGKYRVICGFTKLNGRLHIQICKHTQLYGNRENTNRRFNNLQRLLQFYYYDYPDEICYRPGGSGYQAAFESFNHGTSQVERTCK